ncbi:MAG: VanW family protein [bacterium]|nr:VanW family protein [bacterium]
MKIQGKILLIILLLACGTLAYAAYSHRPYSYRMSAFVTDLKARTPSQRENILRAAASLDQKILQPGEVFSLNALAGPYTEARGYQVERSIRGKKMIFTPGGGVCQVASTLYNAARGADLEIVERVPHTQRVESVPRGMDASLSYAWADLKFRNNQSFPIKLAVRELNDQLLLEVWGQEVEDEN